MFSTSRDLLAFFASSSVDLYKIAGYMDFIKLVLLTEMYRQYPVFASELEKLMEEDISISSFEKLLEFRKDLVKLHLLENMDEKMKGKIVNALAMLEFEKMASQVKESDVYSTIVSVYLTRGILGEMAGYIADACYTRVCDLMSLGHISVAIFTTGEGLEQKIIGSALILENTVNKKPVMIVNAINPSNSFITKFSDVDFVNGFLTYLDMIAVYRGVTLISPVSNYSTISNRSSVARVMPQFVISQDVMKLDTPEFLAGKAYDITSKNVKVHHDAANDVQFTLTVPFTKKSSSKSLKTLFASFISQVTEWGKGLLKNIQSGLDTLAEMSNLDIGKRK